MRSLVVLEKEGGVRSTSLRLISALAVDDYRNTKLSLRTSTLLPLASISFSSFFMAVILTTQSSSESWKKFPSRLHRLQDHKDTHIQTHVRLHAQSGHASLYSRRSAELRERSRKLSGSVELAHVLCYTRTSKVWSFAMEKRGRGKENSCGLLQAFLKQKGTACHSS